MTPAQLRRIIKNIAPTQARFAEAIGVPDRQVRRWLSGQRDIPESVATTIEVLIGKRTTAQVIEELEQRVERVARVLDAPPAPPPAA